MGEIIKEGKLYDVEFHCDICGCEFKESVDICDNQLCEELEFGFGTKTYKKHSCQCPCCHTWVTKKEPL